jgi:plastocyanin
MVGIRRLTALAASTLLAVSPVLYAGAPPQSAATGTIKGRLVWAAGPVPEPKVEAGAANSKDPICKAKPIVSKDLTIDPDNKGVADAFAYLVSPSGDFSATEKDLLAKTPKVVVDQVGCEYVPYATVVHTGQKLTFKSSDPVGHNVDFKPFNGTPINPMLPPNGKYDYTIKKAEKRPTPATCSIHPWMKGYVFIVDHPFAVVTKADGSFEISGVPAGEQHLVLWQSTRGYVTEGAAKGKAVTVKAGETTDVGEIKITK